MAIPPAPEDRSGGFMLIRYTNGTDTHRMRVHTLAFDTGSFIVGGSPAGSSDDGSHDYAYVGSRPVGSELGITDTFQAFVNSLKGLFDTHWTFSLLSLYQVVGNVATEVFPAPAPTPIVGTNAGGIPLYQQRALELIYNFRTSFGGKARLICIAPSQAEGMGPPGVATATVGWDAAHRAPVAYLSGANTAIVAHDGGRFAASANLTVAVNRRLRRHYGMD